PSPSLFLFMLLPPPPPTLFPYTTLFRSPSPLAARHSAERASTSACRGFKPSSRSRPRKNHRPESFDSAQDRRSRRGLLRSSKDADRKSTRLNSSHLVISYAVFCLKKKKK